MTPYRDEHPALPAKLATLREQLAEIDAEIESTEILLEAWVEAERTEPPARVVWAKRFAWILCAAIVLAFSGFSVLALCMPCLCGDGSRHETTRTRASTIRSAATLYMSQRSDDRCPTIDDLFDEGFIQPGTETTDGWDNPFHIECRGRDVSVLSERFDGKDVIEEGR